MKYVQRMSGNRSYIEIWMSESANTRHAHERYMSNRVMSCDGKIQPYSILEITINWYSDLFRSQRKKENEQSHQQNKSLSFYGSGIESLEELKINHFSIFARRETCDSFIFLHGYLDLVLAHYCSAPHLRACHTHTHTHAHDARRHRSFIAAYVKRSLQM